jgi:hypothetical protein
VPAQTLTGTTEQAISAAIQGLTCNSLVHYRARASNSGGSSSGADSTFTTGACIVTPPSVTTNAAGAVGASSATLNATVNPNGNPTTTAFEYGTSNSYGKTIATQSLTGSIAQAISTQISNLTCNTLYHFRASAASSGGTSYGADATFTTAACSITCFPFSVGVDPPAGSIIAIATAQNCAGGYLPNSTITLSANVPKGYDFVRWTGTGGTFANAVANPAKFTITGPATATAHLIAWPPGRTSSLVLISGTVNGQTVTTAHRSITVGAGQPVSGTVTVEINSTFAPNTIMTLATTRNWGPHASSFSDLGHFDTPIAALKHVVEYNFVAPSTAGTYYVILAYSAENTGANVMSCTSSGLSSPVWDNGDDVAGWTAATINDATSNGTVLVNYLYPSGNIPTWVPATAIQLVVNTVKHRAARH